MQDLLAAGYEEDKFLFYPYNFEGKQQLLALASQLITKYNQATEVGTETAVTAKEQVEEVVLLRDMGDYVIQLSSEDIHEAFTVAFPSFDRILYADSEEEAHEIAIEFLIHNKSPIPIASPSTNKQSSNRLEAIEWQRAQIISDADSSSLRDRLTVAKAEMSKVCLRGVL